MWNNFINAILAGIAIALGCIANIIVGGLGGAFLFSCGLLTILYLDFALYTGKAGLVGEGKAKIWQPFWVLFGNVVGTLATMGLVYGTANSEFWQKIVDGCNSIVDKRAAMGPFAHIILSIFCGILVYVAMTVFKIHRNPVMVIIPVMLFVICGFEHSIADSFYFAVVKFRSGYIVFYSILGNFIGCNLIPILWKARDFKQKSSKTNKNTDSTCCGI